MFSKFAIKRYKNPINMIEKNETARDCTISSHNTNLIISILLNPLTFNKQISFFYFQCISNKLRKLKHW